MRHSGRRQVGSGPRQARRAAAMAAALRQAGSATARSRNRRPSRRRLEQAVAGLSAANAALAAANSEAAAFAHSAAHDLRAPLRAIDGFSRRLLEDHAGRLDAEGRRLLGGVRDGVCRMNRLIDDILALCRVGRQEMTVAVVDMAALVGEVLAAPALAGAAADIVVELGGLPPVRGDRRLLQQVWFNLFENAVKFAAPNPVARIEVGGSAGDGEIVYQVRDNGVGFDMRHADRLFVPFQRLHGEEFPGTGLGLAIVKRIVERHGGRVWAEGKPGEGAAFCFALPA